MPQTGQATKIVPAPPKEDNTKVENPHKFANAETKVKKPIPFTEEGMNALSKEHAAKKDKQMNPKQKAVLEQHIKNTNLGLAYKNTKAVGSDGKADPYVQSMGKQQLKQFTLGDRLKFKTNIAAGRIQNMASKFKSSLVGGASATPGPAKPTAKPAAPVTKPKVQNNETMPGVNAQVAKSLNNLIKSSVESNDIKKTARSTNPFKGSKAASTPPNPKGYTVKINGKSDAAPSSAPKGYSVSVKGAKPGFSGYKPPKEPKEPKQPQTKEPAPPKPPKAEVTNPVKEKNIISNRAIGEPPPTPKDAAEPKVAPMSHATIGVKGSASPEATAAHHGILGTLGKLLQPKHVTPIINKIGQLAREKEQK